MAFAPAGRDVYSTERSFFLTSSLRQERDNDADFAPNGARNILERFGPMNISLLWSEDLREEFSSMMISADRI